MFEKEIHAGANWLDVNAPGWELKLDLSDLTMAEGCRCILGQVFKHLEQVEVYEDEYGNVVEDEVMESGFDVIFDQSGENAWERSEWAQSHGFNINATVSGYEAFHTLEAEWTEFVKDRLNEGVVL